MRWNKLLDENASFRKRSSIYTKTSILLENLNMFLLSCVSKSGSNIFIFLMLPRLPTFDTILFCHRTPSNTTDAPHFGSASLFSSLQNLTSEFPTRKQNLFMQRCVQNNKTKMNKKGKTIKSTFIKRKRDSCKCCNRNSKILNTTVDLICDRSASNKDV
jgi:hypothetical protein